MRSGCIQARVEVLHEVDFDHSRFETKQVFVPSKDGTKIPMFIVSEKGLVHDGKHPALLYGYGGFNISLTPTFSVSRLVLARHYGAVVAVANIRGGGEYGEKWHKAGSLLKKQNCFDDFISCSEYLVKEGYTQPSKLCIEGGSNGGLLVAACINQVLLLTRPLLFLHAIVNEGDVMHYENFQSVHCVVCNFQVVLEVICASICKPYVNNVIIQNHRTECSHSALDIGSCRGLSFLVAPWLMWV